MKYRRHRQFLGTPKGVGSRRKEKFYGSVLLCMNGHQQRAEIDLTQFLFNGGDVPSIVQYENACLV